MESGVLLAREPRLAYSPAEAAALIGCSRGFVYSLMEAGILRSVRVGGRRLIPKSALGELVEGEPK